MDEQKIITGTEIAYLHVCPRKLWLFHHGIRPENEHSNVQIGRFVQETSFTRHENEKELVLGNIGVVDWAELDKGVIHEIKKGKAPFGAEEAQVRYYMWWLRARGVNVHTCIIHYPKQKRTRVLPWIAEMEESVGADLTKARRIVESSQAPLPAAGTICKSCAYEEFCFA
jgi:CRISPR-associated exonuclease Cas4